MTFYTQRHSSEIRIHVHVLGKHILESSRLSVRIIILSLLSLNCKTRSVNLDRKQDKSSNTKVFCQNLELFQRLNISVKRYSQIRIVILAVKFKPGYHSMRLLKTIPKQYT